MADFTRFKTIYSESGDDGDTYFRVLVDTDTGANYLWASMGGAGGITPLLGEDGHPVVTPIEHQF